jgi:uncharacterized repeat protein (TIGR03803 family)
MAMAIEPGRAQTFTVLHDFTGGNDGAAPAAGVTPDTAGNLYGTTTIGGAMGLGIVFHLARTGDTWRLYPLYAFNGLNDLRDGFDPLAGVVIGRDGEVYGTTHSGGDGNGCMQWYGCGTLFHIAPGRTAHQWQEVIFHRFGDADGSNPDRGDLTFDAAGHLYGTTRNGGAYQQGTVFELTEDPRGFWTENVLYGFAGSPDGAAPLSGIAIDEQGSLYGTTSAGGASGYGAVYRLLNSGSGWTEEVLYSFGNGADGLTPTGGMLVDSAGILYGATQDGGPGAGGVVFELSPLGEDIWSFQTLAELSGPSSGGPASNLIMDNEGNLYGTTVGDGALHWGSVFKLTRSGGGWSYQSLHDFSGGMDGGTPYGRLSVGDHGELYGTASAGGAYGQGVVFEIVP